MKKKNSFFLLLHSVFFSFYLQAQTFTQQVNASGGGYYNQINGSMQFTIGEPLTETYTTSNGKLYQGFEQGNYVLVSVEEIPIISSISINLFPNPSNGIFNFCINAPEKMKFNIEVTNALGQVVWASPTDWEGRDGLLDLTPFTSALYFVRITNKQNDYIKTYKVIKQ